MRMRAKQPRSYPSWQIAINVTMVLVIVFGTAISVLAVFQWKKAKRESEIALSRQLAAEAQNIMLTENTMQEIAMLLGIQSMRINPSGEAAQVLPNVISLARMARTDRDGYIQTYAFSPDGEYVVSASEKHIARVWEISTGKEIITLEHGAGAITSLAISSDGKHVVSGTSDPGWRKERVACVWEIATGAKIACVAHEFSVRAVDISFDGQYVVSGGADHLARVWEISTGNEIATLVHSEASTVTGLAFSPDSQYVVSGTREDYSVRVWEISTGNEVAYLRHDHYVTAVAFSPNGRYVASGSYKQDGSVRVWEVSTGKEISRIFHDASVVSIAFSPDSEYMISGSEDGTVRIWEISTGKEISRVKDIPVRTVTFSPDGEYALAGDYYENVHQWKWRPGDVIEEACLRVTRNLTRAEWDKYIGSVLPYQAICSNLPIEAVPIPETVTIPIPSPYSTMRP